jgi:hypothetical protein
VRSHGSNYTGALIDRDPGQRLLRTMLSATASSDMVKQECPDVFRVWSLELNGRNDE